MNSLTLTSETAPHVVDASGVPPAARIVLGLLRRLEGGTLALRLPDGRAAYYGRGEPMAEMHLANWNVCHAALHGGDIGFAESFIDGDWSTTDLARLLTVLVRNRAALEQVVHGSLWGRLLNRIRHLHRRNTRQQARRNISAHYDLGNAFYALWLDASMTYSSALSDDIADPHKPFTEVELLRAQREKYARVLEELQLPREAHVLELGCGWGGFAEIAAAAGHRVTGLTLSTEQLDYARRRLAAHGFAHDLRLQDYRDARGRYDGIASIEMFEAVGEAYWPSYFDTLARCLAPGGRACVQTITIDDALFERYRGGSDFIQQYVFPGGMLPSPRVFEQHARAAGLRVVARHAFGRAYSRTLATWRQRFLAQRASIEALGFDARFFRIWEFYLAYCEAAFAEGNTDVVQYTLVHD